jgi:cell division protein FtsB
MDMNRTWTQFAADAEVDRYGTARLCEAHNALRAEVERLRAENEKLQAEVERLRGEMP